MAQSSNVTSTSNDFLLAISVRLEGRNVHALMLRLLSVIAALAALAVKIYALRGHAPQ